MPLHAVLFTHLVGAKLTSLDVVGDQASVDDRKRLMLALMNLGTLGNQEDLYASIDRTIRLWRKFGDRTVPHLGKAAAELFSDLTGADVEDVLAMGFALMAHVMGWKPGESLFLETEISHTIPDTRRRAVLPLLVRGLDECMATLGEPVSEFDWLAIEARPVLEIDSKLLVLDEQFLWRRCTSGLFWDVHDAIKLNSEVDAERFRTAYGGMVEDMVEESVATLAPPVFGDGTNFYTEDDLANAYGTVSRCDAVVDMGAAVLMIEIVSGRLSVRARVIGDLAKLEKDFDRLVIDKCRQIDSAAKHFFENETPLTGISARGMVPTIIPVLVVGGGFSVNPLTYTYISGRLRANGCFEHPRISGLCLLDLEDVDELEGLHENGHDVARLLQEWQASDFRDVPLNNYLHHRGVPVEHRRPARMKQTVDETFKEVIARLGLKPPDVAT